MVDHYCFPTSSYNPYTKLSNVVYAAYPTSHSIYSILQGTLIIYPYLGILICLNQVCIVRYTHISLEVKFIFTPQLGGKGKVLDCVYPEWHSGSPILTAENVLLFYYFLVYILLSLSIKFPGTQRQILNNLTKQTKTMFCTTNFRVSQEIIKSTEKK